jgi:hypothetical protein
MLLLWNTKTKSINAIDDSNAEEGEDETIRERHEIPMLNMRLFMWSTLVTELQQLVATDKVHL